ncbi:MAG: Hsp70 family protein [Pirellulales bacterium]
MGAAIQAALIGRSSAVGDMVVTDVAPFTLGISTSKEIGQDYRGGYFLPIIQRNSTIPCSHVESVGTLRESNRSETANLSGRKSPRRKQYPAGRIHGRRHSAADRLVSNWTCVSHTT